VPPPLSPPFAQVVRKNLNRPLTLSEKII
jgi:aconitate hydratase